MKSKSKFYNEIKDANVEKEVEIVYKKGIEIYFKNTQIKHPFGCDGYITYKLDDNGKTKELMLIMEFKHNENLDSTVNRSKIIVQVLFYLKKFENQGEKIPNVILIGDKNNTFVMHTNEIQKYLDEEIDWSIAPSEAYTKNIELVTKIAQDKSINPFIFAINESFSFKDVVEKIKDLTLNIQRTVRITEYNILKIYDTFINKVVKNPSKIDANKLVYIFMDLMINPNESYKHPTKRNTLVLSDKKEIEIKGDAFDSFFNYFERKYKPKEKEKFTEIADRLIEDTNRRFKGEFYTPTIWVDEAYKMIDEAFGEDWREKYVVWDCAWGTGNLTRDYKFNELYCSTLNESDIEIGKKYNKFATKFQYDFLNDDMDLLEGKELLNIKLPQNLINAFKENKPIIFLINPPYGTANNAGTKKEDHKQGIALTKVNKMMKDENIGASSQQLYAQFLYRIMKIKQIYNMDNVNICIYAKSSYKSSSSFEKFRKVFLNEFNLVDSMLFKASHFADVKSIWGIDFSIWKSGISKDKNNFPIKLKDTDEFNNIITTGTKEIYNMDNQKSCSDWIKEEVKKLKTYDAPQMGSALTIKQSGRGKLVENALGYYVNVSNNVYKNATDVFIVSSTSSMANGISIMPENLMKVVSNFSARKLITGRYANWINDKDEYLVPNINNSKYEEFNNDALIYSLFNTSSNQSSLRNVEYNDKTWNIKNEFFFMSVSEIEELANEYENDEVYEDIKEFGEERFIYKQINNLTLSKEAKEVLKKARELTIKSFKYRNLFNEEKPEYQINTWDAGWYQIKGMLNEYMKDDYKEFLNLYKTLEEKMRPMVYELNFLK